ncbi:MAG: Ig-like domain-containing protein [Bacilli bacterium]
MKKYGFTLIELLAVIVILAIIILIATPVILGVIQKAKIGAAIDSGYGYINSINNSIVLADLATEKFVIPSDDNITSGDPDDDIEISKIKIKGEEATFLTVQFENGKIKNAGFCINGINIYYDGLEVTQSDNNYCEFVVVTSLEVEELDILSVEETHKINVTVEPSNGTVIYESSDETVAEVDDTGLITTKKEGTITISVTSGKYNKNFNLSVISKNDSLIYKIKKATYQNDSFQTLTINEKDYSIHYYVYDSDQIWTTNMTFGNDADVGTASTDANNMIVVKVNGDLTINQGVTVTSYSGSYGGSKGFLLYVTGTITNKGTITGTGKGAKAVGEVVYLWQNENETYEYIPAIGSNGAAARTGSGSISTKYVGNAGVAGTLRGTGGGGSGGTIAASKSTTSGAGAAGTSYSGGTGGGGAYYGATAGSGSSNGGAGGIGKGNSIYSWSCGGGSGNPGGAGANGGSTGGAGTGGLVIISATNIINAGTISSNGTAGGNAYRTGGGGSGGGSVNIFYFNSITTGTITASAGAGGTATRSGESANGGAGGAGTITIGSVATDTFVSN